MNAVNDREELITRLYKQAFPLVAKYISNRGGSFDIAKDIFHDALVICYEKMMAGNYPADETGYLIGIVKHLWLKHYGESLQTKPLEEVDIGIEDEKQKPSNHRLMSFLQKAGNKCMELLTSFYYHQQPLDEIAGTYGFSGVRSATVQKYKCLEKVREIIKQKALVYEDFME